MTTSNTVVEPPAWVDENGCELQQFCKMILGIAGDMVDGGKMAPNAAATILHDLSERVYDLAEKANTFSAVSHDRDDARNEMTALLALLKLQVAIGHDASKSTPRLMSLY